MAHWVGNIGHWLTFAQYPLYASNFRLNFVENCQLDAIFNALQVSWNVDLPPSAESKGLTSRSSLNELSWLRNRTWGDISTRKGDSHGPGLQLLTWASSTSAIELISTAVYCNRSRYVAVFSEEHRMALVASASYRWRMVGEIPWVELHHGSCSYSTLGTLANKGERFLADQKCEKAIFTKWSVVQIISSAANASKCRCFARAACHGWTCNGKG